MVTDQPDCLGQHNTSHFIPLKTVLPKKASWRSAPCWPEEQADSHPQPCFALRGCPAQENGGEGNNFGSCAIKVDRDSEDVFTAAAAWRKQAVWGRAWCTLLDGCGSVTMVRGQQTHSILCLSVMATFLFLSFIPLWPNLQLSIYNVPTDLIQSMKELATVPKGI